MNGFQLVDRIIDLTPGQAIHTRKTWSADEPFLADHFPAFPVIPGVLLAESMQQSGALCLESGFPDYGKALLLQISNARFRGWVRPEQTLDIHVEVLSANRKLSRIRCHSKIDDKTVCESEVLSVWCPWSEVGLAPEHPLLSAYFEAGDQP